PANVFPAEEDLEQVAAHPLTEPEPPVNLPPVRDTIANSRAVIIGGGVVGCAIFRRLAMAGLEPVLVEAATDILDGASKGNSALLHTGFDAPEGSIELTCIQA